MKIEQPGPDTFLQLSDTPDSYSGFGADVVSVKIAENGLEFVPGGGGTGTVTNFIFTNANGVSGSVLTSTTTPTLSLTLGAITPTTIVASSTISGTNLSGTNTGDQTGGTPAVVLGTANTAGASTNFLRRDDTILAFDATSPSTQAFADAAVVGVATVAARRDHKHAMMAAPTTVSGNAGTATALQNARTIGTITGDVTSTGSSFDGTANNTNATTVTRINGTALSALATGILRNTTTTGVPSIAINSDLPVMTATVGGAVPTPPNNTTTFLRGDATFAIPTVTGFTAGAGTLTGPAVSGVAVTLGNAETITGLKTMSGLNVITHSSVGGLFRNPANTFNIILTTPAITVADRTLNLPLITGTDTLMCLGLAQTVTGTLTLTTPVIGVATGTSLAVTGLVTSTSKTAGVGYATGAGTTGTQGTSRITTLVANGMCGTFTMFSAAQAANALVTFTFTNSAIAANDMVIIQHNSATDGGAWNASVVPGAGSCTVNVRNVSTASVTSATPFRWLVLKGAVA